MERRVDRVLSRLLMEQYTMANGTKVGSKMVCAIIRMVRPTKGCGRMASRVAMESRSGPMDENMKESGESGSLLVQEGRFIQMAGIKKGTGIKENS
jgi:hypothetical protein